MTPRESGAPLWAVTTFFNPAGYRSRLRNFRVFREHLSVPVLAVELSFNGHFELQDSDADILLRWRIGDVMWQKERLLNGAWAHLPPACTEVAWLDCDIVFADADWATQAHTRLQGAPVLHGFSSLRHLAPDARVLRPGRLQGSCTSTQQSPFRHAPGTNSRALKGVLTRGEGAPTPGIAWIARRNWISGLRLYDLCIAGGGDTAWSAALLGQPETAVTLHCMNSAQQRAYLPWAQQVASMLDGPVGCLPGDVWHLWHGALKDRQSQQRHAALAATGFDPACDLVAFGDEPWRWSDPQAAPARYLRRYFEQRREDGTR